jgi:hypothetical protein
MISKMPKACSLALMEAEILFCFVIRHPETSGQDDKTKRLQQTAGIRFTRTPKPFAPDKKGKGCFRIYG